MVLVMDSPKELGIPPDCSGRRLRAAPSAAFREDADDRRPNNFRLIPLPCLASCARLAKAQHLLVVPYPLRGSNAAARIVSAGV